MQSNTLTFKGTREPSPCPPFPEGKYIAYQRYISHCEAIYRICVADISHFPQGNISPYRDMSTSLTRYVNFVDTICLRAICDKSRKRYAFGNFICALNVGFTYIIVAPQEHTFAFPEGKYIAYRRYISHTEGIYRICVADISHFPQGNISHCEAIYLIFRKENISCTVRCK